MRAGCVGIVQATLVFVCGKRIAQIPPSRLGATHEIKTCIKPCDGIAVEFAGKGFGLDRRQRHGNGPQRTPVGGQPVERDLEAVLGFASA